MNLARIRCRVGLLLSLGAAGMPQARAQVMVFAAASLRESVREAGKNYEGQTGRKLVFNFAGSSTLARQIEEGVPADLFFSADEAQMDRLETKGLLVAGTRHDLLSNTLVIIAPAGNEAKIGAPRDLSRPAVRRIALGHPKSVPVGVYARKFLEQQGLWAVLAAKVVPTENVRGALVAVESGNADAGIVYRTDALISKRVSIVYTVPPGQGPAIRYPAAVVRGARDPKGARDFLDFLASAPAAKIFQERGFEVTP